MRDASNADLGQWDELVTSNPDGGHFLQTRSWGEFKRMHGWKPRYLVHKANGKTIALLALQRHLSGLGTIWYVPKGPGVSGTEQLAGLVGPIRDSAAAFCVKIEPELEDGMSTSDALAGLGLVKARHDVQVNRATIVVDLRDDEERLLASFKPKTRYNIRLASRRGVEVGPVPLDDDAVDVMYELMSATRDRAGFTLRTRDYFAGYWRLLEANSQGQLFFARWQGRVLAGAFAAFLGRKAWYKDGGSLKEHSDVMAPHLLQWEVMRWLRSRGIESYDLVAVPRRVELAPAHPLWGLYRFKSGFSDHVVEYAGTWDLPVNSTRYSLWSAVVERSLHQWAHRVRHDLFY